MGSVMAPAFDIPPDFPKPAIVREAPKKIVMPGDPCFITPDEAAIMGMMGRNRGGDDQDLFLVVGSIAETPSISTPPAGWTQLLNSLNDDSSFRGFAYYRYGTGLSGTFAVGLSGSEYATAVVYRIPAGSYNSASAPELAGPASSNNAHPNPPELAPSWGSDSVLWIATGHAYGKAGDDFTGAPSGFTQRGDAEGGNDETATSLAYLVSTAASQNPGAWGSPASGKSMGCTIGVRGGSAPAADSSGFTTYGATQATTHNITYPAV